MKKLTSRERRFIDVYINGGDGVAPGDARAAYRLISGGTDHASCVWRMINRPRVALALDEAHRQLRFTVKVTAEQHIMNLQRIRELAIKKGDMSSAQRAEKNIGEVLGFYTQRRLNLNYDATPRDASEARRRLVALVNATPGLRELLAGVSGGAEVVSTQAARPSRELVEAPGHPQTHPPSTVVNSSQPFTAPQNGAQDEDPR